MKTIRPSSSYRIVLPEEACERKDERVSSYWIPGQPTLLQMSSYIRDAGDQIAAEQRLQDRIAKSSAKWSVWNQALNIDQSISQAIGQTTDENGLTWLHIYLAWPHLTVYATISGPADSVVNLDDWALKAMKELKLNVQ